MKLEPDEICFADCADEFLLGEESMTALRAQALPGCFLCLLDAAGDEE